MESKQNRALKEFDSLYKMIDDVYHEIALSMHLTDSAFLIYLQTLLHLKTNGEFFRKISGRQRIFGP